MCAVHAVASPRRILIVEDDAELGFELAEALVEAGYEVERCGDGREALERLGHDPLPDLIVLDLLLPVLDGWEFRLRQREFARYAAIPVLAISAESSARAAAIDSDYFLSKPFTSERLLQTVNTALA